MSITNKGAIGGGVRCASLSSVNGSALGRSVLTLDPCLIMTPWMKPDIRLRLGWLVNWHCLCHLTLTHVISRDGLWTVSYQLFGFMCDCL